MVLDLRYEARDIEQHVHNQDKIDLYFEKKTAALNDVAKAKLKSKWASMQKLYSSRDRLNAIAKDIVMDFDVKARTILWKWKRRYWWRIRSIPLVSTTRYFSP